MNLNVWRHTEAEDRLFGEDDMARALTARGCRQARRMGRWLDSVLPGSTCVLCSPARRAVQTADACGRKFELSDALAPNGSVDLLIERIR